MVKLIKYIKKNKVFRFVSSKNFSIASGVVLIIITISLSRFIYVDSLNDLSIHVDSINDIYANRVERKIENIEFNLSELAVDGLPVTQEEINEWNNRADFYVKNTVGLNNIVVINSDLVVTNAMPLINEDYPIGTTLGLQENQIGETNFVYPIYNGNIIEGFIIGNIDVPMVILSSDVDFENQYIVQVFKDDNLLASSMDWNDNNSNITSSKNIIFKNITYEIRLLPTQTTISNTSNISTMVFLFGLFVSFAVSYFLFRSANETNRLENLVTLKTSELSDTIVNLKQEKELAQNYLNIAGVMIVILGEDGKVKLMNKKGCEIIGEKEEDIVGQNWFEKYIPHEHKDTMVEVFTKVFNTNIEIDKHFVNEIINAEGEKRLISWNNTTLYDESDNPIGVLSSGEDITRLKEKEDQLSYLSYRDQLTGLYNRRFFEEELIELNDEENFPLSIIMGDVNGLKLINDAFGHKAGDQLLTLIGSKINETIRGNDIAARWGGDEFTILLPKTSKENAEYLIKRIRNSISNASFEYGSISIAFGLDTKVDHSESISEIFSNAEQLMYQNKLAEIDSVRGETIKTIMNTLFEKSEDVQNHSIRVSELSVAIAEKMGLSQSLINDVKTMAMLHDIGKIVIDLHILNKPGRLTDEEYEIIKQHPLTGSRMLNASHEYTRLSIGLLHHHERIDGKGYPNQIKGDQIPLESKIIAIADAYDAMTAIRPYRLKPLSKEEALQELIKHSGTQFDEKIVKVFVETEIFS